MTPEEREALKEQIRLAEEAEEQQRIAELVEPIASYSHDDLKIVLAWIEGFLNEATRQEITGWTESVDFSRLDRDGMNRYASAQAYAAMTKAVTSKPRADLR